MRINPAIGPYTRAKLPSPRKHARPPDPKDKRLPDIPVSFTVPGDPVSRQAHAHARGITYLPGQSRNYQLRVAAYAQKAMCARPPIQTTVALEVVFVFTAPKSLPKANRARIDTGELLIYARIRQDIDNLCKNLLDGLKGVAVADDRLVVDMMACKRIGIKPCTIICLTPISVEKNNSNWE